MEQKGSATQPVIKKRNVAVTVFIYKSDSTFRGLFFPPSLPYLRHVTAHRGSQAAILNSYVFFKELNQNGL